MRPTDISSIHSHVLLEWVPDITLAPSDAGRHYVALARLVRYFWKNAPPFFNDFSF